LIVSNTSPLVYLAALDDFEFLQELFSQVAIPRAVHQEIAVGGINLPVARAVEDAIKSWLFVKDVTSSKPPSSSKMAYILVRAKPSCWHPN